MKGRLDYAAAGAAVNEGIDRLVMAYGGDEATALAVMTAALGLRLHRLAPGCRDGIMADITEGALGAAVELDAACGRPLHEAGHT